MVVTLDLDPPQALLGQVLRVVHVDDVVVALPVAFLVLVRCLHLLLLFLEGDQLALSQVINVDLTLRLVLVEIHFARLLLLLFFDSVGSRIDQASSPWIHLSQLVDLV